MKCIAKGHRKGFFLVAQRVTDLLRVKDTDMVKLLQDALNRPWPAFAHFDRFSHCAPFTEAPGSRQE